MKEIINVISLPESNSSDVLAREIHIIINGEERIVKTTPDVVNFKVPAKHGDQVSIFVVDIYNAAFGECRMSSEPSESLDWLVVDNTSRRPGKPVLVSVENFEKNFLEDSLEEVVQSECCNLNNVVCDENSCSCS